MAQKHVFVAVMTAHDIAIAEYYVIIASVYYVVLVTVASPASPNIHQIILTNLSLKFFVPFGLNVII